MIIAAVIVGGIMTWVLVARKRLLQQRGLNRTTTFHLVNSALEFAVPFTIAAFLYLMLWALVVVVPEFASVGRLMELETSLAQIRSAIAIFKLSALHVLVVLAVLLVLRVVLARFQSTGGAYRAFDKYRMVARRAYTLVVLLCSFTLFGAELGAPTDHLTVRINRVREGYADVCRDVEAIVSERIAERLYGQVEAALPQSYRDDLALPPKIGAALTILRTTYEAAQKDHQIRNTTAGSLLERQSQKAARLASRNAQPCLIKEGSSRSTSYAARGIEKVTWRGVKRAKAALQKHRPGRPSRTVTLLRTEGGKRLVCHLPKVLTAAARNAALGPLIEEYPILGPVVDVFRRTLDKELEMRVEQAVCRAAQSATIEGMAFEDVVRREVTRVAEDTTVQVSEATRATCTRTGGDLRAELAHVQNTKGDIDNAVAQSYSARIDGNIRRLSSRDAGTRLDAAKELARMGDKLSESHVQRLTRVMRTGGAKWSKFLYRSGHCNWYEDTSIRYYAGVALDTKSQYISEKVRGEARSARQSGKSKRRVTDPGWICF